MKLLSMVSKGNRIAKVRTKTDGTPGFEIVLTELKSGDGKVTRRHYTRFYKMFATSLRDAQQWVDSATE